MIKNNSGITLATLIITVIVITIIATISVYEGKELIIKAKVESLETNMLTIQAKAKSYADEIDAKIWTETDKDTARNNEFKAKGFSDPINLSSEMLEQVDENIKSNYVAYTITGDVLKNMGLDEISDETYIVVFNKGDGEYKSMDIIYQDGVKYKGTIYFSLSKLHKALEK